MAHRMFFAAAMAAAPLLLTSQLAFADDSAPTVNGQSLTQATRANGPSEQFGAKGQIAISSDAALTISHTSLSGGGSSTNVELGPAIDYFVIQNLSVGGSLEFNYSSAAGGHATRFGLGPRVGYNIGLSDLISIWPKLGLSFASTNTTTDAVGSVPSSSATNTAVALNVFVPVMFHPAPHFFVGFGPFIDTDLSGDQKATTYGAKLTLGGWVF